MSAFDYIVKAFGANWTTVFIGWRGLGVLSSWPNRWIEFPPLLSAEEILNFSNQRLASSLEISEQDLIISLLSLDFVAESRESILNLLKPLADLGGGDSDIELRKWRVALLDQLLENLPKDSVNGLTALTEFWLGFGFPHDSPHEVQGRENIITPSEYYTSANLDRLVARHHSWIQKEKASLSLT